VNAGTSRELSEAEVAAYDAPFPDDSYKAGARQFPALVPSAPDDPATPANRAAWAALGRWEKPFVCAFGDRDPITGGGDVALRAHIPGADAQPHATMEGAAHFSQEDAGPELAAVVAGVAARLQR
jgi:haloalkane dehalogenase